MSVAAIRFDGAVGRCLMNTDWCKHFSLQHGPDVGRRSLLRFEKAVHRDSENEHILIAVARDLAGAPGIHPAVLEQRGHLLLGRAGLVPSRVAGVVEIPITCVIRLALRTTVAYS